MTMRMIDYFTDTLTYLTADTHNKWRWFY